MLLAEMQATRTLLIEEDVDRRISIATLHVAKRRISRIDRVVANNHQETCKAAGNAEAAQRIASETDRQMGETIRMQSGLVRKQVRADKQTLSLLAAVNEGSHEEEIEHLEVAVAEVQHEGSSITNGIRSSLLYKQVETR
jgi:hypothetical protein